MAGVAFMPTLLNSAEMLEGMELEGGWTVLEMIKKILPDFSGGNFSKGYKVKHNATGKIAFLKAIDLHRAFNSGDFMQEVQMLTNAYMFERHFLEKCKDFKMDRIVTPITHGQVQPANCILPVYYLIFEMAEGDIRKVMTYPKNMNDAWKLRSLHQTATALNQLHTHKMAHQDVKPSNVLIFDKEGSKLGDVGRSVDRTAPAPHEDCFCAGDLSYAPPELLYGYRDSDWIKYRVGCDFFLLGSQIMFMFAGTSMTSSLRAELDPQIHHEVWQGTYSQALPYLRVAFNKVIDDFSQNLDILFKNELTDVVRQLCEPDIDLRGLPGIKASHVRFSLQPYISKLDRLALKAELSLRRQ